jgi:hypothetical protein
LAKEVIYPVTVGIDPCNNKSVVLEVYRSKLPDILLFNSEKSKPRLYCVVFSHPISGFANNVLGIEPGELVATKDKKEK